MDGFDDDYGEDPDFAKDEAATASNVVARQKTTGMFGSDLLDDIQKMGLDDEYNG